MTYAKKAIPKALKTAVWLTYVGRKFETKCHVTWCKTLITPFTFETGHNVPESKGGETHVANLRPICAQCNKSMGNRYSIDEFSRIYESKKKVGLIGRLGACLRVRSGAVAPERQLSEFTPIPNPQNACMPTPSPQRAPVHAATATAISTSSNAHPNDTQHIHASFKKYASTRQSSQASNAVPLPQIMQSDGDSEYQSAHSQK